MSEYIPRSPWGHQPRCAAGDTDRHLKKGTHSGWRTGGKQEVSLGPGRSTRSCTNSLPGGCVEGYVVNWVRPGAAWMTDERSESWGLCAGLSTVNPRKGPPCGEVTSSMADPKKTRKPVIRHRPSGNSATASWGSLGWRIFIQKDVLQLCLDWPGILLQETLEGEVFQKFQVVQCSTWMPLVFYQEGTCGNPWQSRAGHTRPGRHWEPSLASTRFPHLHVRESGTWGEVLPLDRSRLVCTCWLGVLSQSHLNTGCQ